MSGLSVGKPQLSITPINFGGGLWQVTRPRVFRYENHEWIDKFFETGLLRLSTFKKFSTYPDEQRGDSQEGVAAVIVQDFKNGKSSGAIGSYGHNCYVLCCSLKLSSTLGKSFGRDSQFQIFDPTSFAYEISRMLPGFNLGAEGCCIYDNDGSLYREQALIDDAIKTPDGKFSASAIHEEMSQAFGKEVVFLKRRQYEHQQEYRLLWQVDHANSDHIDIICPRAVKFCRKISSEEIGQS